MRQPKNFSRVFKKTEVSQVIPFFGRLLSAGISVIY